MKYGFTLHGFSKVNFLFMTLEVEYRNFQDIGKILIDFRQFGKKIIAIESPNIECSFPKKQSEIMITRANKLKLMENRIGLTMWV